MTAINAGRGDRNTVLLQTNVGHNKRRATDKYWNLLFVVSYFILAILWPLVVEHDDTTECQNHSDSNTVTNQISEISNNKTDGKVIRENITFINTTVEYALTQVWGKHWLLDAITLNVGFLDAHYDEGGFISIWAHVVISVGLIIYSFASIRTKYLYRRQMEMFIVLFVMITGSTRILHFSYQKFDATPSEMFLWYWPVPELILFIIVLTKSPFSRGRNTEDNGSPDYLDFYLCPFLFFYLFSLAIPLTLSSLSTYKLNWDHQLSYLFFGAICYMCMVLYYYILMVMTCATSRSLDLERRNTHFGDFFRSWVIVARYHFGTLCYHATLIIPRVHATFIMFEKEFTENRKLSLVDRIYLTHWKIPNLVSTMTAARGHDSSSSIRELLRLFTSDSPRLKNYQNHNQILRTFSALLIAINSLFAISLWAHGVVLDPRFLMAVFVSYLFGTFIQYLLARYHDSVADAFCLYFDRRDVAES